MRIPKSRYGSLKSHTNTKLAHCYYGPYQVIKRVGEVAYQLLLPSTIRLYDVFHVFHFEGICGPIGGC